MKEVRRIIDGFLAGMLISIGGAVFLACYGKNADGTPTLSYFVGALLFCTALFCICVKGYALYTGRIGYVLENHKKDDISSLLLGLLGNALGTIAFGYLLAVTFPGLKATAEALCNGKLDQGYGFALIRATMCGILVYLAVDIFKKDKTPLGILLCIPCFILSGYEHSIADIFYFATSGIANWTAFGYLWMIILGNSVGALIIPALRSIGAPRPAEEKKPPEEPKVG